eukprot:TRINITY_DN49125_c0_g1_i1.p1 TRINITY_DN49125_c0_g1~~TRINITY_DN49125_c0_g1_i1.p1  ORF type:complete len:261 (+),score=43.11 TRINITY_DN49125_c0_g1_i1:336-1118(+)
MYDTSSASLGELMPCCEKEVLLELLAHVDRLLCGKVEYALMYGTLLAAVRDSDLIDWDTDVDVVVHEADMTLVESLFGDNIGDFYVSGVSHLTESKMLRVYWGEKNTAHVDIYFIRTEGNCSKADKEWFPQQWLAKPFTGRCDLQGRRFPCPADSERILSYLYGDGRSTVKNPGAKYWRNRELGNDKGNLYCENAQACKQDVYGFSCNAEAGKVKRRKLKKHKKRRWYPREPEWATEIRFKALDDEENMIELESQLVEDL